MVDTKREIQILEQEIKQILLDIKVMNNIIAAIGKAPPGNLFKPRLSGGYWLPPKFKRERIVGKENVNEIYEAVRVINGYLRRAEKKKQDLESELKFGKRQMKARKKKGLLEKAVKMIR